MLVSWRQTQRARRHAHPRRAEGRAGAGPGPVRARLGHSDHRLETADEALQPGRERRPQRRSPARARRARAARRRSASPRPGADAAQPCARCDRSSPRATSRNGSAEPHAVGDREHRPAPGRGLVERERVDGDQGRADARHPAEPEHQRRAAGHPTARRVGARCDPPLPLTHRQPAGERSGPSTMTTTPSTRVSRSACAQHGPADRPGEHPEHDEHDGEPGDEQPDAGSSSPGARPAPTVRAPPAALARPRGARRPSR